MQTRGWLGLLKRYVNEVGAMLITPVEGLFELLCTTNRDGFPSKGMSDLGELKCVVCPEVWSKYAAMMGNRKTLKNAAAPVIQHDHRDRLLGLRP